MPRKTIDVLRQELGTELARPLPPLRPRPELTRQQKWRAKQIRKGNCIVCGKPQGDNSPYKHRCLRCVLKARRRNRTFQGSKPWERGKSGRPPMAVWRKHEQLETQ